jgi:hypothetical protein
LPTSGGDVVVAAEFPRRYDDGKNFELRAKRRESALYFHDIPANQTVGE